MENFRGYLLPAVSLLFATSVLFILILSSSDYFSSFSMISFNSTASNFEFKSSVPTADLLRTVSVSDHEIQAVRFTGSNNVLKVK